MEDLMCKPRCPDRANHVHIDQRLRSLPERWVPSVGATADPESTDAREEPGGLTAGRCD